MDLLVSFSSELPSGNDVVNSCMFKYATNLGLRPTPIYSIMFVEKLHQTITAKNIQCNLMYASKLNSERESVFRASNIKYSLSRDVQVCRVV